MKSKKDSTITQGRGLTEHGRPFIWVGDQKIVAPKSLPREQMQPWLQGYTSAVKQSAAPDLVAAMENTERDLKDSQICASTNDSHALVTRALHTLRVALNSVKGVK